MNIIDIQDNLKNLPEQALMQEMQRPTGSAPQFLVLGELKRRKQMREDYKRQQNADMKTVAEEVVTAAGAPQEGIMQMARSLNPNTNMAQDTGLAQATPVTPTQAPQPQAPQMMSDGGIMRLQTGGYPDDLSRAVGHAISYNRSNQGRGVNTPNANVIDAYLRGELDPSSTAYRDMVTFEQLNGRDKLREISSQIVNPFGQSPYYSSRDEITPRMSQEDAMATRRRLAGGAGIGSVSADAEDFAATPSYERGTGRATMIDGTFVEVMPDGNVFNARTGEMVTGELAQAAVAKLTPNLTADNAAFAEAQGMPSVYNPEATMPSQTDLDLRAQEVPAPDVFPNDISSFDTDAAYNAEQAQRRAEAARMMGINEIPTQQPTFKDDVLPFVGGVAGDLASLPFDIIAEGIAGSPEERLMAMPVEAGDPTQAQITMLRRIIDDPEADTVARTNAAQQLQELQNRIAVTQTGGNLSATAEDGGISIPEGYVMGPFGVPRVDPNYRSPGKTGNSLIDQAALQGTEALTTLAESGAVDPALASAAESIAKQADFERDIYPVNVEIAQLNAAANNPYLPEDLKSGITEQITNLEDQKSRIATATDAGSLVAPDVDTAPEIPSETVGGYAGLIAPNVIEQESSLPESTTTQGDAAQRAADSMMGTGITSIGGRGAAPKGVATTPVATKDTGDAGFGSMDSRIAQMLSNRQKEAEADKWMALAVAGAEMMKPTSTIGEGFGKAAQAGIGYLQQSKKGAQAFETDMLKLQTQLDIARQRARSSKSSKNIPATALNSAQADVESAQTRLLEARTDAERLSASRALKIAQGRYNQLTRMFDTQYGVPIANANGVGGTKNINLTST
jgi:hypothetical protein